jgi:hypothetical protein
MWIGLLTGGTHPDRPRAAAGVATLFTWGPRERARIDGPEAALADGVRMLRRAGPRSLGAGHDPRCFTCRAPYVIPDPEAIRGQDDIRELGERLDDEAEGDPRAATVLQPGTEAVFALVHVDDGRPIGSEGEALVFVPGTSVVSLIPLDCLGAFAGILRDVGYPEHRCERCATVAPGGSLGAPGRAARRRRAGRRAA